MRWRKTWRAGKTANPFRTAPSAPLKTLALVPAQTSLGGAGVVAVLLLLAVAVTLRCLPSASNKSEGPCARTFTPQT